MYFIKIDFSYSSSDSIKYLKNKQVILSGYDTLQELYLSANNVYPVNSPILLDDTLNFPDSFQVVIYNADESLLLKTLDYDSFIKNAKFDPIYKKDPLKADSWTLVIDSTLLNLK